LLHSYTKDSPGRGVHILAYGALPSKNIHTAIEMYGYDRFTTITTDHIAGTPTTKEQRQEAICHAEEHHRQVVVRERRFRWEVGRPAAEYLNDLLAHGAIARGQLLSELVVPGGISGELEVELRPLRIRPGKPCELLGHRLVQDLIDTLPVFAAAEGH